MISLFTLNVSEDILNKFNDLEIHNYYVNFCIPTAFIYENNKLIRQIENADYDRINSCLVELRGREKGT